MKGIIIASSNNLVLYTNIINEMIEKGCKEIEMWTMTKHFRNYDLVEKIREFTRLLKVKKYEGQVIEIKENSLKKVDKINELLKGMKTFEVSEEEILERIKLEKREIILDITTSLKHVLIDITSYCLVNDITDIYFLESKVALTRTESDLFFNVTRDSLSYTSIKNSNNYRVIIKEMNVIKKNKKKHMFIAIVITISITLGFIFKEVTEILNAIAALASLVSIGFASIEKV